MSIRLKDIFNIVDEVVEIDKLMLKRGKKTVYKWINETSTPSFSNISDIVDLIIESTFNSNEKLVKLRNKIEDFIDKSDLKCSYKIEIKETADIRDFLKEVLTFTSLPKNNNERETFPKEVSFEFSKFMEIIFNITHTKASDLANSLCKTQSLISKWLNLDNQPTIDDINEIIKYTNRYATGNALKSYIRSDLESYVKKSNLNEIIQENIVEIKTFDEFIKSALMVSIIKDNNRPIDLESEPYDELSSFYSSVFIKKNTGKIVINIS